MNLSTGEVESNVLLGSNFHGGTDTAEIIEMEQIALADESVKAAIEKLQLPEGTTVISDPWMYGTLLAAL